MYFTESQFEQAYRKIVEGTLQSHCSVLVFFVPDGDAVCACRIITTLLKSDMIAYELVPVSGYAELQEALSQRSSIEEDVPHYKSVVLINCGGVASLSVLIDGLGFEEDTLFYVLDSHRPLELHNIYLNDQCIVLAADGFLEDIPSIQEYLLALNGHESSDDEESEGDEYVGDEGFIDGLQQPQNGVDADRGRKRNFSESQTASAIRRSKKQAERRNRMVEAKHNIENYYRETHYGASVAFLAYDLAKSMSKANSDLLWLAIVGVADQLNNDIIDRVMYTMLTQRLHQEVLLMQPDETDLGGSSAGTIGGPSIDCAQIIFLPQELRFMLLRHWSLWEAMYHSNYVATTLRIWSSDGRKSLDSFLARLGLPLNLARQPFSSMPSQLKEGLLEKIGEVASMREYGLKDITMGAFEMKKGWCCKLSASDVAYSLEALLEGVYNEQSVNPIIEMTENNSKEDGNCESNVDTAEGLRRERRHRNIFAALDALASRNAEVMQQGLKASMQQHRAIVRQAIAMLSKKEILHTRRFSHAIIQTSPDAPFFVDNPTALNQLAIFIMRMLEMGAKFRRRPLVCGVLNQGTGTYLTVGRWYDVIEKSDNGEPCSDVSFRQHRSRFGQAFRQAAEDSGAKFKHDGFDAAIIEVLHDDFSSFLEYLALML